MNQTGYSSRTLIEKLGIKPDYHIFMSTAPTDYFALLGDLPPGVLVCAEPQENLDLIQLFVSRQAELHTHFTRLSQYLKSNGMLWVCWPKQSSKAVTDLNENIIRDFGLTHGMVDVKVCAINETWSGLKFVYRLANRATK